MRAYPIAPANSQQVDAFQRYVASGGSPRWWETSPLNLGPFDPTTIAMGTNLYVLSGGKEGPRQRFLSELGKRLQDRGYYVQWVSCPMVLVDLEADAPKEIARLLEPDFLIMDDWNLSSLTPRVHRLVYTLLRARYDVGKSTVLGSTMPVGVFGSDVNVWSSWIESLLHEFQGVQISE